MLDAFFEFIKYDGEFNFWKIVNSQFFSAVVLGLAGIAIQGRFRSDRVDELASSAEAKAVEAQNSIRDTVEDLPETLALKSGERDHRNEAKNIIARLKQGVNQVVQNDPDSRHHRVYRRLGRVNYKALVQALYDRSQLTSKAYKSLMLGFSVWDDYAVGRVATKPVPQVVLDLLSQAEDSLA